MRSEIVRALKDAGYPTAADHVRHSYLPGQTVATLVDIENYYRDKIPTVAVIISRFQVHSA